MQFSPKHIFEKKKKQQQKKHEQWFSFFYWAVVRQHYTPPEIQFNIMDEDSAPIKTVCVCDDTSVLRFMCGKTRQLRKQHVS